MIYPFQVIIVSGNEAETAAIRREVTNLSVTVEHEFADIDQTISQRPLLADSKCLFFVKVNSSAAMDQLARLSQFFTGRPIVALLNDDSDMSAVMQIQRAGAAQVLLLPLRPGEVRAALDTVVRQFGCPTTSSKVIAVLGANEGCGSTTLAVNLSDAFAKVQKQSCILVELSLRLGRLGWYLGIEPTITTSDLLAGDNVLDVNTVKRALIEVTNSFQVIAGPHRGVDRRPIAAARVVGLIQSVRQIAAVVVLDLPYTLDDLYFEALSVADQVVLVAGQSAYSIQALKVVSEAVAQRAVGTTQHMVINGYGPRAEKFSEVQMREALGVERIWTIVSDPCGFEAAARSRRPLHLAAPLSRAWPAITALAHQITGLGHPIVSESAASWPSWLGDLLRARKPVSNAPFVEP